VKIGEAAIMPDEMNLNKVLLENRKTGQECIFDKTGEKVATIQDYWQWAYSSLLGNTERGNYAEYLVAVALGIANETRIGWDKYDLKTRKGITVEVKASGYLQTWSQQKLSKPVFGIRPTKAWDYKSNEYESSIKRQADVYVFCVHNYMQKDDGLNPLDLKQWDFYVLPTKLLNEKMPTQKTITLEKIKALGVNATAFNELEDAIDICMEETK